MLQTNQFHVEFINKNKIYFYLYNIYCIFSKSSMKKNFWKFFSEKGEFSFNHVHNQKLSTAHLKTCFHKCLVWDLELLVFLWIF